MSGVISFSCLLIVGALCLADVMYQLRRDSQAHGFAASVVDLAKTAAASAVSVWSLAALPTEGVDDETEPVHLALHVGLAALAIGLAWRRWRHRASRIQGEEST